MDVQLALHDKRRQIHPAVELKVKESHPKSNIQRFAADSFNKLIISLTQQFRRFLHCRIIFHRNALKSLQFLQSSTSNLVV
jgi:hypothetical protein